MTRSLPIHVGLVPVVFLSLVAACAGATGGLGSVPTSAPTPSVEPTGPDLTAAPSASFAPSTEPSSEASPPLAPRPGRPPGVPPATSETMIVRAYFVLGGEPGT